MIGQAKGILRERHQVDEQTAFSMLAEESQRTNVKVRDLAQRIVDSTGPGHDRPSDQGPS